MILPEQDADQLEETAISPASLLQRIEGLRRVPWYSIEVPPDVARGQRHPMIHADERRMLYTLARDYYSGQGRIIDGGTFLGSSSLALGSGLRDQGFRREPVIDAFDTFIIDDFSVTHHLDHSDALARDLKGGDSILSIYQANIAPVSDYIAIHEGDLLKKTWGGKPIEILFSDISKGWSLNDYILMNWIPYLIPEAGILIQQDQVQEYHVWVAITMSMMADYFEMIDYVLNDSVVYRLKREIPRSALERCLSKNITPSDMEFHYRASLETFRRNGMGRYKGWTLGMVELGMAVTYGFHIGDADKARYVLRDVKERFGSIADTMYRAGVIEGHLEAGTPCPGAKLKGSGMARRLRAPLTYDERLYIQQNLDVQEAVQRGEFLNAWEHAVQFGYRENRAGLSPEVVELIKHYWSLPPDG